MAAGGEVLPVGEARGRRLRERMGVAARGVDLLPGRGRAALLLRRAVRQAGAPDAGASPSLNTLYQKIRCLDEDKQLHCLAMQSGLTQYMFSEMLIRDRLPAQRTAVLLQHVLQHAGACGAPPDDDLSLT